MMGACRHHRHALRRLLAASLLFALAACASAPPGHRTFAVAAKDAAVPATWILDSLPAQGRIGLRARTLPESTPGQVSQVHITFDQGDREPALVVLSFADGDCTGAYSFSLGHRGEWQATDFDYFDRRLPWGAQAAIGFDWSAPGRMDVEIAGVGRMSVALAQRPSRIVITAGAGGLRDGDLELEDLHVR